MIRRYGRRVSVSMNVIVAGDRKFAVGRMLDMSLPGCLIECRHTLKKGDYVQLRTFLPDQTEPVDITLAAVRWIHASRVGMEFIRTSEQDQHRLRNFIRRHASSAA
ncbi:MAG TPA: PilZ domain-containing protein [Nitrospira sp.]